LGVILGAVWEEVKQDEDEVEFLKNCYVIPEASAPSLALAKELIEQKVASDDRVFTKSLQPGHVANLLKEYSPEKPIVVIGNVGNGKTTFLRYLRKIEAVDTLGKYIQINIDFIDRPAHASEVSQFVYSRIEEQLRQPPYSIDVMDDAVIRAALNADINRFKKSPEGRAYQSGSAEYIAAELAFINSIRADKHEFYKRIFIHLRGRGSSPSPYSLIILTVVWNRFKKKHILGRLLSRAIGRVWSLSACARLRLTSRASWVCSI